MRPPDLKPLGAYCCWDFVPVRQGLMNFLAPNSPCTAAFWMCTRDLVFMPSIILCFARSLSAADSLSHPSGSEKRSFIVTLRPPLMVARGPRTSARAGLGRARG